ncbi:MAG: hypothetical protein HUU21_22200 [Polyangiaceae bacterium]|nr:hypothetical protein [Polyangiaceae bacterium]
MLNRTGYGSRSAGSARERPACALSTETVEISKDVTRERLAAELPEFFPNVEVEVDNAIEV